MVTPARLNVTLYGHFLSLYSLSLQFLIQIAIFSYASRWQHFAWWLDTSDSKGYTAAIIRVRTDTDSYPVRWYTPTWWNTCFLELTRSLYESLQYISQVTILMLCSHLYLPSCYFPLNCSFSFLCQHTSNTLGSTQTSWISKDYDF
jgi:hypothetical protein